MAGMTSTFLKAVTRTFWLTGGPPPAVAGVSYETPVPTP